MDTLKNALKFSKTSQVFGGEGLKVKLEKLISIFTFQAIISYNDFDL